MGAGTPPPPHLVAEASYQPPPHGASTDPEHDACAVPALPAEYSLRRAHRPAGTGHISACAYQLQAALTTSDGTALGGGGLSFSPPNLSRRGKGCHSVCTTRQGRGLGPSGDTGRRGLARRDLRPRRWIPQAPCGGQRSDHGPRRRHIWRQVSAAALRFSSQVLSKAEHPQNPPPLPAPLPLIGALGPARRG